MKSVLTAIALAVVVSISLPAVAAETRLLTIGVCPPWKKGINDRQTALLRGACKTSVEAIEASFRDNLKIPANNTYRLLDAGATYASVVDKMTWLRENTKTDDTVFIYLLAHGGELRGHYKGYPVTDQGIALWSVKKPNVATAADKKVFMLVRTFRDMMDKIAVKRLVLIVDSCHSGAAFHDFRDDPVQNRTGETHTAVVLSARDDQYANFNLDNTMPMFSEMLTHALKVSAGQPFSDAVLLAGTATHRRMKYNCQEPGLKKLIAEDGEITHYSLCTQQPVVFDPSGLMDGILVK